jgi:hypothetical protein
MTAECGRNAQQMVSYRDIRFGFLNHMLFFRFLANFSLGLPTDVRVLVMADSASRRWSAAFV